jgi:hypothetical protein
VRKLPQSNVLRASTGTLSRLQPTETMKDQTMYDIKDYSQLFQIQIQGAIATAFVFSGVPIEDNHWDMMTGSAEITMRDLGEIGFLTGVNLTLNLSQNKHDEQNHEGPNL